MVIGRLKHQGESKFLSLKVNERQLREPASRISYSPVTCALSGCQPLHEILHCDALAFPQEIPPLHRH